MGTTTCLKHPVTGSRGIPPCTESGARRAGRRRRHRRCRRSSVRWLAGAAVGRARPAPAAPAPSARPRSRPPRGSDTATFTVTGILDQQLPGLRRRRQGLHQAGRLHRLQVLRRRASASRCTSAAWRRPRRLPSRADRLQLTGRLLACPARAPPRASFNVDAGKTTTVDITVVGHAHSPGAGQVDVGGVLPMPRRQPRPAGRRHAEVRQRVSRPGHRLVNARPQMQTVGVQLPKVSGSPASAGPLPTSRARRQRCRRSVHVPIQVSATSTRMAAARPADDQELHGATGSTRRPDGRTEQSAAAGARARRPQRADGCRATARRAAASTGPPCPASRRGPGQSLPLDSGNSRRPARRPKRPRGRTSRRRTTSAAEGRRLGRSCRSCWRSSRSSPWPWSASTYARLFLLRRPSA